MNKILLNPIRYKFWIDDLLHYPTTIYNGTNFTFKVAQGLQEEFLIEAYRQLMLEYFPFHSTIYTEKNKTYFLIKDCFEVPLEKMEMVSPVSEDTLKQIINSLVCRPFRLKEKFPCRFYWIKTNQNFYLLHSFHHIAMDGLTAKDFCNRLSEAYRKQILSNNTIIEAASVNYMEFLEAFRHIVSKRSSHIAIIQQEESITYQKLKEKSDAIAIQLEKQGIQPQHRIGLHMRSSINSIATIIGILKAGCSYVPIDVNASNAHRDYILKDAGCCAEFEEEGLRILHSDIPWAISVKDEACVIYTSGSTGRPKGVPICHSALAKMIHAQRLFFEIYPENRILQFANLCFDVSISEIFATLFKGGTLVIAGEEAKHDPETLIDLLKQKEINCADIPPAMLSLLPHRPLPQLHTLLVGGESAPLATMKFWSKGRRLINAYRSTENTINTTMCIVDESFEMNDIGTPLPGVLCYVLDRHRNLVPDGVEGELYIGGVQLTEGYINRPGLNKEKFVPNPFVSKEDKAMGLNLRLYRSGDLVKRRSDGHLVFIGRADFQVKLHGFRIELGDIESKILEYKSTIAHAVVIVHEHNQTKQLVAYLQTHSTEPIDTKPLKAFLQNQLPPYMVPALFIQLEKLPLNASGKLDRKALPSPELFKQGSSSSYDKKEEPQTSTEKELAALWSKVLETGMVGREDNFIALGGDSMSIILLTFAIEETFGISMRTSELYKHLSLAEMATAIEQKSPRIETETIYQTSATELIPLAPSQMELWMQCAVSTEMKDAYNLPVLFECPARCSEKSLAEGLNRCIELQDSFRISFPLNNGVPSIRINPVVPVDMHIKEVNKDKDLTACCQQDVLTSFDLENGPLFRATFYKSREGKQVFLLVMHHLISDGWSVNLLQEVLLNAAKGIAVRPEMLTGSYREYALSAHRLTTSDSFAQRKEYWKAYFSNVEPLRLFAPLPDKKQSVKGFIKQQEISLAHSNKIQDWCRSHSTTLFSFYYAAFLLLLAKLSGQSNFLVGFPSSGRESSKYRKTIGYFVNMLPICYESHFQELPFPVYLNEIKDKIIKAENYALSANYLLEAAGHPLSDDPAWPLVKAVFAYEEDSLFVHYRTDREISTFPLTLSVVEKENGNSYYIEYQETYIEKDLALQILSGYLNLIEAILENPDKKVKTYRVSSLEYQQQIIQKNSLSQQSEQILPTTFLDVFYRQTDLYPQHVALNFHSTQLTYHELEMKSSSIARYLQNSPQGAIGVCMRPSLETYIVILGIWKAGRIFVPIDTDMPDSRKDFIFKDASCKLLFADERPDWARNREVCTLTCIQTILMQYPDQNERNSVSPDSYAYYIYTSGTTGIPKGIPIRHSALGHLISVEQRKFNLQNDSKVLQFASISFDAAITEIFTTWAAGATLVVADYQQRHDPMLLADLLEAEQVTCATIPPALLPLLPKRNFPALETIIVGGEPTAPSAISYWSKGRRFINAYGPTENTVDTTLCIVGSSFEPNDIGMPLPGVSCYVLDEAMNIVPDGMTGELYIGGLQLTDGYLNRPDLAAQAFIKNPFLSSSDKAHHVNLQLYKSGDLVKRRPDGHLIFIGRTDNQIKLNGYRIELGEIETRIQECDNIQNAIVLLTKDAGKEELAAYVQPAPNTIIDYVNLRNTLSSKLPTYMIPTKWAVVKEFPLTVNGKTDKQKLPKADIVISSNALIPATTTMEYSLLKIAKELLETEDIGVTTDLMEAGMSSLQIMEFSMTAHQAGFRNISISSVYKDRTIRKILKDHTNKLYFWANDYDPGKPVMVLVCGYPYYSPFYDNFVKFFSKEYSIFVLESHHEFFLWKKDVSLNLLLETFDDILQRELKDKKIAILTGYCMACELCIAYAQYRLTHHPHSEMPRILNMEGVFQRIKGQTEPDSGDELINEHLRITTILSDDLPPLEYAGEIINCMAKRESSQITLEGNIETDLQKLQERKKKQEQNWTAWQQHFPSAPFYLIDCDHWHFFEEKNLVIVNKAIHDYWGDKIK